MSAPRRTASELEAAAAAKRAEAQRAVEAACVDDPAVARLAGPALRQHHSRQDSARRRFIEANEQASYLEWRAGLARAREAEAARVHLTAEEVRGAQEVRTRHGWRRVVRVNAKSVTVETGWSWTDRVPLAKVLEVR